MGTVLFFLEVFGESLSTDIGIITIIIDNIIIMITQFLLLLDCRHAGKGHRPMMKWTCSWRDRPKEEGKTGSQGQVVKSSTCW